MKLLTARELLRKTGRVERTAAVRDRLTCRWEQDTSGKLFCIWTLQREEADARFNGLRCLPTALLPCTHTISDTVIKVC